MDGGNGAQQGRIGRVLLQFMIKHVIYGVLLHNLPHIIVLSHHSLFLIVLYSIMQICNTMYCIIIILSYNEMRTVTKRRPIWTRLLNNLRKQLPSAIQEIPSLSLMQASCLPQGPALFLSFFPSLSHNYKVSFLHLFAYPFVLYM